MDKGWEAWVAQTAELHTYHADWENRKKEGRGFYKLSEETVAAVREDLAKDYHELEEQHSEELVQLLEDFSEGQEELLDHLLEVRGRQQHAGNGAEQETAGTTEYEQANTHDPTEGVTSQEQTQSSINPQPEEPIIAGITEPEIHPATCEAEEAGESAQQP